MRLRSFAITTYRHLSSEANWSSSYLLKNGKKSVTKVSWTQEQKQVLDAVCNGESVFITGSAGTGKTFLLHEIIKKLKKIHGPSRVYVTASTGVAACTLQGQTLHSFAGVGLANLDRDGLLQRVLSDTKACSRWVEVKALVIDEISMIDAELFEGLAHIARMLRGDEQTTWGGIQLIVSGDFFQLPPVRKKTSSKIYAFEADSWSSSFDPLVELTTVFRQSDSVLVRLLQNIRKGVYDLDELKLLEQCCSESEPDPSAVRLYPRLEDVNKVNKEKLERLNKEIYVFKAQDSGKDRWIRQLKRGIAPDVLQLCVGARVMLIKNLSPSDKLVNGATGTVLKLHRLSHNCRVTSDMCSHGNVLPLVKFDSGHKLVVEPDTWSVEDKGKVVARRRQLPLILSWALSIHKCQGMSLDKLHTNLSRVFEFGMAYVALSRVRSLEGLQLSGFEPSCIRAHPKVLEFYGCFKVEEKESIKEAMRLCSFATTTYQHLSSEAAAFDKTNWSSSYRLKNKKKSVTGSKTRTKSKISWTEEQKQILDAVCNGNSVFITGSAGTGKTFLLEEIIKKLKKIHGRSRVYVTASTGVAACTLQGQTLHSFAGVGLANMDRDGLLERILSDTKACSRWRKVKALVIDEISMIDAEFFDGLAHIARMLRGDEQTTWGGIQLIVSGDFFQLPPVRKKTSSKIYAFEADSWSSSFDLLVELTTVFRQSDSVLVRLLQNIRKGVTDLDELKLLEQCCSGSEPDPSAVRLYPRLEDVNKVNKEKLEMLNEETYVFKAQDLGQDRWIRQLKRGIAPDELQLCVGARVMLIKNLSSSDKLVNGATGTVVEFHRLSENDRETSDMCSHGNVLPLVEFDSGLKLVVEPETWSVVDGERVVGRRKQIPLILSWALSIHKCQGMSIDKLHTNLSRAFECGMVYVALSRVISLEGLHLSDLEPSCIRAHPKVLEFYRGFSGKELENKL